MKEQQAKGTPQFDLKINGGDLAFCQIEGMDEPLTGLEYFLLAMLRVQNKKKNKERKK